MSACSDLWWNQLNIKSPATAAQKLDVSNQPNIKNSFGSLLSEVSKCKEALNESLTLTDFETALFKRFLYKLNSVFIHDKGFKVLKQIQKSITRFKSIDIQELVTRFEEQHSLSLNSSKFIHVAPRPVYQHLLIRTQGSARLLAQTLCYCHAYGLIVLQKLQQSHFININIISMGFAARFWVLSLHLLQLLLKLHELLVTALENKEMLPANAVQVLPPGVSIVRDLREHLTVDKTLSNIHDILKSSDGIKPNENPRREIWNTFGVKNDKERMHLEELKSLVVTKGNATQIDLEDLTRKPVNKSSDDVDIGVLVSRGGPQNNNNGKRKRTKKRKRNHMEN